MATTAETIGAILGVLTAAGSLLVVVFKGGGIVKEQQLTRAEVAKANAKLDLLVPEQAKMTERLDSHDRRIGVLEQEVRDVTPSLHSKGWNGGS